MPATTIYMREYRARQHRDPSQELVRSIAEYWRGYDVSVRVERILVGKQEVHCIRSDIGERMRL